MRKSYFILAAAATILASCAENGKITNDLRSDENKTVIGFSTYSEKATRATGTNEDLETYHGTFAVYATKKSTVDNTTISPVFNADIITYDDSKEEPNNWTYSPYRFWDKQANYHFVAVAPNADVVSYSKPEDVAATDGDYVAAAYTLKGQNLQTTPSESEAKVGFHGNSGQDTDLMTATKNPQNGASHDANVNMIFKHILAKLNISIAKAKILDDAKVVIKKVEVSGLDNKGKYAESDYKLINNVQQSGWSQTVKEQINSNDYILEWTNATGVELNSGSTDGDNKYTLGAPLYFIESLVMPQSIEKDVDGAEKLYLEYEITTGTGASAHTEAYKYELKFRTDIQTGTDAQTNDPIYTEQTVFAEFMDRSNYTLKLTIEPQVIKFDAESTQWTAIPAVEKSVY